MKRVLSLIMVLALVLAAVPAVFAAEELTTNEQVALAVGDTTVAPTTATTYTAYCFTPTEVGVYTITPNAGQIGIAGYGLVGLGLSVPTTMKDSVEFECSGVGQEIWVAVTTATTSIEVEKTGTYEAPAEAVAYPYATIPDDVGGKPATVDGESVWANVSGSQTAVKGEDGYYHLNSATGPIVYVNLASIGLYPHEGGGIKCNVGENYYEFVEMIQAYGAASKETGIVKLTEDLAIFLQNYGPQKLWCENGLWADDVADRVDNLKWLYPCYYVAGGADNVVTLAYNDNGVAEHTATQLDNAKYYYSVKNADGYTLTVTGTGSITVNYDGNDTTAENTVTVTGLTGNPYNPANFTVKASGEVKIHIQAPLGHMENPDALVISAGMRPSFNVATVTEGSQGYCYTYTATAAGKLTLKNFTGENGYQANMYNLTSGAMSDTIDQTTAADDNGMVSINVAAGDKVQVSVNTYDSANWFSTPAGSVSFSASFDALGSMTNPATLALGANAATMGFGMNDCSYYYNYAAPSCAGKLTLNIKVTGADVELIKNQDDTNLESLTVGEHIVEVDMAAEGALTLQFNNTSWDTEAGVSITASYVHTGAVHHDAVPMTHTSHGSYEYYACATCEKNYDVNGVEMDDVVVYSLGHERATKYDGKPATHTEDGVAPYYHCDNCGKDYAGTEWNADEITDKSTLVIHSMGHEYAQKIDAKPATHTENGMAAYYYCSVCGKNYSGTEKDADEITDLSELVIPAQGHIRAEKVEGKPATHTEDGVMPYYHCDNCGKDYVSRAYDAEEVTDKVIPALGHGTKMNKIDGKPATHTEDGTYPYYYCSVCEEYYFGREADAEVVTDENKVIPAEGHIRATKVDAKAATCTEDGNVEYWYCASCDKNFEGRAPEAKEVTKTVIPATGHKNVGEGEATEPGCHTWGNVAYKYCFDCNQYLDKDGKVVENVDDLFIAPENELEWFEEVKATNKADGMKEHWYCEGCGKYYIEVENEDGLWELKEVTKASLIIPKSATPTTGDNTALVALVTLAVLGSMGIAVVTVMKKRAIR